MNGDRWTFIAERRRDGYRTVVTVPASEHPTREGAMRRVAQEFSPPDWTIGVEDAACDHSARALLARLDWAKREPRSAYDATMLAVVGALVDELDAAMLRLRRAEEGLRTLDAMRLEAALREDER